MTTIAEAARGLVELGRAMGVTIRYFFTRPITVQFPEEKVHLYPRYRGRHELQRHPDGLEKCVGCALCAAACPTKCIYVEAAENAEEDRRSPGERYARVYEINLLRCMFCGLCEEACPTGAVVLRRQFALADYSRDACLLDKERLLQPAGDWSYTLREDGS